MVAVSNISLGMKAARQVTFKLAEVNWNRRHLFLMMLVCAELRTLT